MKKLIQRVDGVSTLAQLRTAVEDLVPVESDGLRVKEETVHISVLGEPVSFNLYEETLTDGSYVYNIEVE